MRKLSSFQFKESWMSSFDMLESKGALELYSAICHYAIYGQEPPEFTNWTAKLLFDYYRLEIDDYRSAQLSSTIYYSDPYDDSDTPATPDAPITPDTPISEPVPDVDATSHLHTSSVGALHEAPTPGWPPTIPDTPISEPTPDVDTTPICSPPLGWSPRPDGIPTRMPPLSAWPFPYPVSRPTCTIPNLYSRPRSPSLDLCQSFLPLRLKNINNKGHPRA